MQRCKCNGEASLFTPATLRHDHAPWYHFTHAERLSGIKKHGLLVEPPQRTYAEGDFMTIGGIYVGSGQHVDNLRDRFCDQFGDQNVVVLQLRLRAGTRFCLDEDEIDDMQLPTDEELFQRYPSLDSQLIKRAVKECFSRRFMGSREKLSEWSCRLAHNLNQNDLEQFMLRLFDPPEILGWRLADCP